MNHHFLPVLSACLLAFTQPSPADFTPPSEPPAFYPPADHLRPSPGDTTYYISPRTGDDTNDGLTAAKPWRSFAPVNAVKLAPGDRVIIAPGVHPYSLKPTAAGSAEKPVMIEFRPGVHEFAVADALRRPWYISRQGVARHAGWSGPGVQPERRGG